MISAQEREREITFNNLYFVCYMIERTARSIRQRNRYVVEELGSEGLKRQLSIADTSHCLNPDEVVDSWKKEYCLLPGDFDVTVIDNYNSSAYYEPSYIQIRAYYAGAFL